MSTLFKRCPALQYGAVGATTKLGPDCSLQSRIVFLTGRSTFLVRELHMPLHDISMYLAVHATITEFT